MVISHLMLSPISPKKQCIILYYPVLSHVLYRIILYYASKHIFLLGLMGLINYAINGINGYTWLAIKSHKWL